ncbi:YqfQ family protein [Neobacillus sp. MER 74]|uniref:YqfQ family protein n=1 Tax=unclassified Neobacillus TaxID=2675272 RepID=UPI00203E75C2|nr:YqfQ family protein [Neobacillus sp. MER 74]MCM3114854.1 YqfQ family protein [Neobacillus sp. MER 74]
MQPRSRMPMQGGMGPGPFGRNNQMMNPGFNPFGSRSPMMGPSSNQFGGGFNPMMGQMMGRPNQMNTRGGGILSKLFGRSNQAGGFMGMQSAGKAASGGGGLLQSLSSPGGLTSMLNNTQQVLKTAQSLGPMVQQYGPMIKNLPAMWKIYKGFKNATKDTDAASDKNSQQTEAASEESSSHDVSENKSTQKKVKRKNHQQPVSSRKTSSQKGSSIPKMYI